MMTTLGWNHYVLGDFFLGKDKQLENSSRSLDFWACNEEGQGLGNETNESVSLHEASW